MKTEIKEMTGLRGIAAGFIIINHLLLLLPSIKNPFTLKIFGAFGLMGMSLFFILSGFVIFYNYADKIISNPKQETVKFLIARFARLYPLYILFLGIWFLWNIKLTPETLGANITSLPIFITGMQSWFFGFINDIPVVHLQGSGNISWSISTEFALYLFFIPLILIFKDKILNIKFVLNLFIFAVIGKVIYTYSIYNFQCIESVSRAIFGVHYLNITDFLTFYSPLSRIFEFLAGGAIAYYFDKVKNKERFNVLMYFIYFISIATIIFIFSLELTIKNFNSYTGLYYSIALMFLLLSITHFGCKILTTKLLVFLGEISYSLYLLHILFIQIFRYGGDHLISYVLNIGGFVILVPITAYISYKYYEMPARKWIRNVLSEQKST